MDLWHFCSFVIEIEEEKLATFVNDKNVLDIYSVACSLKLLFVLRVVWSNNKAIEFHFNVTEATKQTIDGVENHRDETMSNSDREKSIKQKCLPHKTTA